MNSIDLIQQVTSWALRFENNKVLSYSANIANAGSAAPQLYGQNLRGVLEHMRSTLAGQNERDILVEASGEIKVDSEAASNPIALDQQVAALLDSETRYKALVEIINRKSALRNAVIQTQR